MEIYYVFYFIIVFSYSTIQILRGALSLTEKIFNWIRLR